MATLGRGNSPHPHHITTSWITEVNLQQILQILTKSLGSNKVWQDHLSQAKKVPPWPGQLSPCRLPSLCWRSQHQQELHETEEKVRMSVLQYFLEFHVGCFDRYGDIFSLYVGRTPVVILNSYELIKSTFDRWTFLKNTSLPKVPNKSTSLKYPCCCSEQRTKSKNSIKLSIKMFRAEYSGRPGNFSGTFFQKGKTGGSWWFWWKNRWMFWFSGISTTDGKHWRDQRDFLSKHLAHLTGLVTASFGWSPLIQCILSYWNTNIVSAGDGCRGFEDVIMDEVKSLKHCEISHKITSMLISSFGALVIL